MGSLNRKLYVKVDIINGLNLNNPISNKSLDAHAKLWKRRLFLFLPKDLNLCYKFNFCNPYIFATWLYKPLIFQTHIIWSNSIHSLKFQRSTTLGCSDIEIRKSEFVAKAQFLYLLQLETLGAYKFVILKSTSLQLIVIESGIVT